jgi:cell division protein FtsB
VTVAQDPTPSARRRAIAAPRTSKARRALKIGLVCVGIVFAVDAFAGDRGLLAILRARREYEELSQALDRQRAENARLREEARRLRDDPGAIEELARRDLGLIRPGERVFIVKDLKSPGTP